MAEFIIPDQDVSILLAILGFVDDITNQVKKFYQNDVTVLHLLASMQQDSQLCALLLWLTGGQLELYKGSYHVIYFEFKDDDLPQLLTQPPDTPL
eukprot:15367193-Ditylum_brightwellii.AAC.2